jgi:hypothetical protein
MNMQKLSKTTLAWRLALTFALISVVVFGALAILQLLGLASYGPFVAGAVAGAASVIMSSSQQAS